MVSRRPPVPRGVNVRPPALRLPREVQQARRVQADLQYVLPPEARRALNPRVRLPREIQQARRVQAQLQRGVRLPPEAQRARRIQADLQRVLPPEARRAAGDLRLPPPYQSAIVWRVMPEATGQRHTVLPQQQPRGAPVIARPQPGASPSAGYAPPSPRVNWGLLLLIGLGVFGMALCAALALIIGLTYADGILPGVYVSGIALGGLSESEAVRTLETRWTTIVVRDGERIWAISPASLGLTLDPAATASAAYAQGRGDFRDIIRALIGRADLAPVVTLDAAAAEAGLIELAAAANQPPVSAGVRLVGGEAQPTPPINGRALDTAAALALLQTGAGQALADGWLELPFRPVAPVVTDSTPLLDQARRLLTRPLDIRVFDPVTGDSIYWSLPPEQWAAWLTAASGGAGGLRLTLDSAPLRAYLAEQSAVFDPSRGLDLDRAAAAIQEAVAAERLDPVVTVSHRARQHIVQRGETLTSIAWDYGIPYPYIQGANSGISTLAVGQSITIPPADSFLLLPPVADQRIVVSLSQQRTRVYENGALKWDWPASTGIAASPTWPGVYQIISHVENAYAGNWNLWMPNFLGVYKPVPGSDFTNGFHGFPTRGSSQLLWTNDLGRRVTYGCILLSSENARLLYDWAPDGVVVEIRA